MNRNFEKTDVLIAGGGVSGASLAIRLASKGIAVTIVEKDKFPRHKLCGEFISPECLTYFRELGVLDSMREIGGDTIRETRFFAESGKSVSVPSDWFYNGEYGALGISRSEMDFRLLTKARECGAKVFENSRVVGIEESDSRIESINVKNVKDEIINLKADLIVDATGRTRVLGKLIEKTAECRAIKRKVRHIAFKTHFKNVNLEKGVCEIYFFRGGYGGLSWVENGIANHCFLIDSKVAREFKGNADRILNELIFKNARAVSALKTAEMKIDWLAVSIETFGRQPSNDIENLISVGDASAFIDPFTGSGMLMALESGKTLADQILNDTGVPAQNFSTLKSGYQAASFRHTKRRLRVCSLMNRISFSPRLTRLAISVAGSSQLLLHRLASSTRPIQY